MNSIAVAQLLSLFVIHNGRVPGFEFEAEGFSIAELVEGKFIFQTKNHLDAGRYLMGPALEKECRKNFSRVPVGL